MKNCTHPYTLNKHCIKCNANNVEPIIERITPEQEDKIIQERRLSGKRLIK